VSSMAEVNFRRPYNANRRLRFRRSSLIERILKWLSSRTARLKWGRQRWLACCIVGSRLGKPRLGAVHLAPLLSFQRKSGPCPCDVDKNISHSRIWCLRCHISAFGGTVPASFRSKHGQSPEGTPRIYFYKTPPGPGRNRRGFRCAWHGMDLPS
jgi:hypothetical protein